MHTVSGSQTLTMWLSAVINFVRSVLSVLCHLMFNIGLPYLYNIVTMQIRNREQESLKWLSWPK